MARLEADHRLTPGLAVILVGSDPASEVYVGHKHKATVAAGMRSFEHRLPEDVPEETLFALIDRLNGDPEVHGIPLPVPPSPPIWTSGASWRGSTRARTWTG